MEKSTQLTSLDTPAAIIDRKKMQHNIDRMQQRMNELGVSFRPHVKSSKCLPVVQAQIDAGANGITVSTLKEAGYFYEHGIKDILYAVGITPSKLGQILELRRQGCQLKIITDSPEAATAIGDFGKEHQEKFDVLIEVDTDGHRSGLQPGQQELVDTARILAGKGVNLLGVMTHAGSSYEYNTLRQLQAIAEQERCLCVQAADRIRQTGIPCPVVSVGSTPTALSAVQLDGVTEVRAGVYVFFDLFMHNVGVCSMEEIALSVLTTVIGHQKEKGWAITDAGWMAMSRDQGTRNQQTSYGYGQVCDINGIPLPYTVSSANQEHGIISHISGTDENIAQTFPLGTMLRILPNHACATGAQFPAYQALDDNGSSVEWPRIYGW